VKGDQQILSELNRVKVLFQQRTIALVLGAPLPKPTLPPKEHDHD